ncbi:ppp2r4B [Symbiodinium sp. CCMP2592]|nr:ppp2r4B [Symbiodinium sp. CCMP2592]
MSRVLRKRSRRQLKSLWAVPKRATFVERTFQIQHPDMVVRCSKSPVSCAVGWGEQLERGVLVNQHSTTHEETKEAQAGDMIAVMDELDKLHLEIMIDRCEREFKIEANIRKLQAKRVVWSSGLNLYENLKRSKAIAKRRDTLYSSYPQCAARLDSPAWRFMSARQSGCGAAAHKSNVYDEFNRHIGPDGPPPCFPRPPVEFGALEE